MEILSLGKLNEYIRRVITLNFDEPVWIIAELIQCKLNKGHYYVELAERSSDNEIIAQNSGVIWKTSWTKISSHFPSDLLQEGNQFKLKAQVDFHPKFGLKLIITDIDETYTLGEIAKQKKETIANLVKDGLWQKNKSTILPQVIKRIAVITSLTAAGKQDFESHLLDNEYAYTFHVSYFPCAMQGQQVRTDVSRAISLINKSKSGFYDCIIIIRGGGAKLDLIEFDHYEISKEIALSNIPVLTGIGHHQDESIADMNAFLALKTPTAVADYIIEINLKFESQIHQYLISIEREILITLDRHKSDLFNLKNSLHLQLNQSHHNKTFKLYNLKLHLFNTLEKMLNDKTLQLTKKEHLLDINNPLNILAKGYSMSFQNDKRIKNFFELNSQLPLETIFIDGKATSKIIEK